MWSSGWELSLERLLLASGVSTTGQCNFEVLTTNHITKKLTNQNYDQRHKYHHLTKTWRWLPLRSPNVSHQQVCLKITPTRKITQDKQLMLQTICQHEKCRTFEEKHRTHCPKSGWNTGVCDRNHVLTQDGNYSLLAGSPIYKLV